MKAVIAYPQTRQRHCAIADLDAAGELRILPGTPNVHVDRQQAPYPRYRRRQSFDDAQIYAVATGMHAERPLHLPLLDSAESQVYRKPGLHLKHVLAGSPQEKVGLEFPVGVVHHSLHERRLEVAESSGIERHGAPERRCRCRPTDPDIQSDLTGEVAGVSLQETVHILEIESQHPHRERPFGGSGDPSAELNDPRAVDRPQSKRADDRS
jgi:hypothetical protein